MHRTGRFGPLAAIAALALLGGCDRGQGIGYGVDPTLNADKANPAAATRQQCIDAGYETGTIQYTQCITQGAGLPRN